MIKNYGKAYLLFIALFVSILSSVFPQEDDWYTDKIISDIQFEGLSSISQNELTGLVRPYIGQKYTDSLSWDIQSKLYALDYFDIIIPEIKADSTDNNSIILTFKVQEKPVVESILFSGNDRVRRNELLDAILVKSGDMLNPGTLKQDEESIKKLYLEKGFIDAQVTSSYDIDDKTNQAVVTFSIEEGAQTKISEIRFVGNDKYVSDKTLKNLMKTKPQSLFNKGLFVETKLQEDLKAIERYYGDHGFINMKIKDVNKDIVFNKEDGLNQMIITIVIEEGEPWKFGGITFEGNKIYSDSELQSLVQQKIGDTFNQTQFQMDYQRITDLYFENGYIFNSFVYDEIKDEENKTVSYKVTITERDRAHIENIIIRGNDKTKSYVIRREIPLDEGEVFSKKKIMQGVMNLHNLQFFDAVEPNTYPGSEDGLMDLVIDVSEGKTSDISFGLSFSGGPDFPISGQVKWNDRNFLGRGQTLGVDVSVSPDIQNVNLRFTEPKLFGLRWSGGVYMGWSHNINRRIDQDLDGNGIADPYNTWQEYDETGQVVPEDYQMEYYSHNLHTGFNSGYTWITNLGRVGVSGGLNLNWEYVIYDSTVYRPLNPDIRDNYRTWKYDDSISTRVVWDTTDITANPTKGFLLSERLIFAGILPQSRRDFIKSISRFNYNLKLFDIPVGKKGGAFKSILYLNTVFQGLFDKPWTDASVDRQRDGFYIDGMFVARGWDASTGYKYIWNNTAQLKFPIVKGILAFDIFFDAVGAWVTDRGAFETSNALLNMNIADWRFSMGIGPRFDNPQFPIGIYLVKKFRWDSDGKINWNPEPDSTEIKAWNMDLVIAFNMDIF